MLVKYNGLGLYGVGAVVLKPGVNKVSEEAWKQASAHPVVKAKIEAGKIEVVSQSQPAPEPESAPKPEGEEGPAPTPAPTESSDDESLKGFKVGEAVKLVKETIDLPLLEKWLENEKRAGVKKALSEQIEELKKPPVLRDEKKAEQAEGAEEGSFDSSISEE